MKKIFILFLTVVLFSTFLTGCIDNVPDNESPNSSNDTTINNNSGGESANVIHTAHNWDLKELKTPDIKETILEKKEIPNTNKTLTLGITPFDYKIEDFKEVFSSSDLIKEKYNIGTCINKVTTRNDFEEERYNIISNKIVGVLKEKDYETNKYFDDLEVNIKQNTSLYSTPHEIWFLFDGLTLSTETQSQIYEILKKCIGENYANFLVYAKDTNSECEEGSISEIQLEEKIETENVTYTLSRQIRKNNEKASISFSLCISDTNYNNRYPYNEFGSENFYDNKTLTYQINDIFPQITDFAPSKMKDFAKEYYKYGTGNYEITYLGKSTKSTTVLDDGRIINHISVDTRKGGEGIGEVTAAKLKLDYTILEKDSKILNIDAKFTGDPGGIFHDEENNTDLLLESYNIQKEQISFLFPTIDVPKSSKNDSSISKSFSGKTMFLNKECDFTGEISVGRNFAEAYTGEWTIELSYSK